MLRPKWSRITECLGRRAGILTLLLPCLLIVSFYFISGRYLELDGSTTHKPVASVEELVDGYLVWNSKCHMVSEDPMDPSIAKFVKKIKFEPCSEGPQLSSIERDNNGVFSIVINENVAKNLKKFICCWSPLTRPAVPKPPTGDWDSKINLGKCVDFENRAQLPHDIENILVSCRIKGTSKNIRAKSNTLYENIHSILNPLKVQGRLNLSETLEANVTHKRKLSVLVLGIDSVSRLNFLRSMPKTAKYLRDNDWYTLKGYNKMGDNTFPNLMAILTGQNSSTAYNVCKPFDAYGLDNCPFLWHNFRNAGYVTAYAEDVVPLSTFNYLKVGFVEPPTDYYLRPYIIASEKYLKSKKRFNAKYCTGPVLQMDRVIDYALTFAKTFQGYPYFGFFWTNTISHNDMNGPSSMDDYFVKKFEEFEKEGVMNDTLMIFLSDHGMRWGEIRNTFVGWYEERLPFIYIRPPDWMRDDENVFRALRINEHRLLSPYDLYETFRDIIIAAGGDANVSTGCSSCQSILKPVPVERGCEDAGISAHWCTCTAFKSANVEDEIAKQGAKKFLEHVENIVKEYKDKKGKRLCAKLRLKKIHRVDKIIDLHDITDNINNVKGYFYLLEVTPGGGRFETTIMVNGKGNYTVSEDAISRINSYAENAKCLNNGSKKFCYCIK